MFEGRFMGRDFDEVVDVRSGLAYLLVKWKIIVLAAVIGAVIGGTYGGMKSSQSQSTAVTGYEETISNARAACSEEGALYAEQLSAQYKAYNSALSGWGTYLDNSVLQKTDPYDYVKKDIQYSVVTDNVNTVNAFSSSLLSQSDLEAIGAILEADPLTASLEEIVAVSGNEMEDEDANYHTDITNNISGVHGEVMTVSIAAPDESKADLVAEIVEKAVDAKAGKIQAGGVQMQIKKVDEAVTRNDSNWLLKKQLAVMDKLVNFQIDYSLFIKNTTDILQGSQRTYYKLLISLDPEKTVAASSSKKSSVKSIVKYGVVGGGAGLVIALLCAYLLFVFSNKIQSGEELRNNYGLSVLQRFRTGETKKWDVIRNRGLSAMGMDRAAQISEAGAASLGAELERRTAQMEKKQVYLTCDCTDEKSRGCIRSLAGILSDGNVTVVAGDPRESEKAYKELLGSGLVVMAEVLNGSRKKDFNDLLETCRRNELPVLGCVTLLDTEHY